MGVREDTLSEDEKRFLDDNGYLIFPGFLSAEVVQSFRARLEELSAAEQDRGQVDEGFQAGTIILKDLVNKDPATRERLNAAALHILDA